ncbi:hypothetical protein BGW38_003699, partial [Lunasporangiospora selenospora]
NEKQGLEASTLSSFAKHSCRQQKPLTEPGHRRLPETTEQPGDDGNLGAANTTLVELHDVGTSPPPASPTEE